MSPARIYSIGHSTRSLQELVEVLRAHGVQQVGDIRAIPASRRHPHFARAALQAGLASAGIAYRWMPAMGGQREASAEVQRFAAWREPAFQAYAAHMETVEFADAVDALEVWARVAPTAFLCAEREWKQCHRQLTSDALYARGWTVLHLRDASPPEPHRPPAFARFADGRVTYVALAPGLFDLE